MHILPAVIPILANVIEERAALIGLFESILVFIQGHIVASWGLAIVGLTVLVRAVMMPATFSQFRSMRKMQVHAPQLKAIKEKYKDDKQRQNEETTKTCQDGDQSLRLALPPPQQLLGVHLALLHAAHRPQEAHLRAGAEGPWHREHEGDRKSHLRSGCPALVSFLFVPDITARATGVVLVVLILLYVGSQIVSTLLMSASAEPSQRWMMLALPLFFVVILFRYPAGLLVYWITTNLWTIAQGYFVRRSIGPHPPTGPPIKASPRRIVQWKGYDRRREGRRSADACVARRRRRSRSAAAAPQEEETLGAPAMSGSRPRTAGCGGRPGRAADRAAGGGGRRSGTGLRGERRGRGATC